MSKWVSASSSCTRRNPLFQKWKGGSVVQKVPSGLQLGFHLYLCLLIGNLLHTGFLGWNMPRNDTTGLLLHGIQVPWGQTGGKPCSEAQPHGGKGWTSSTMTVSKRLAIPEKLWCYLQESLWQTCYCSQPVFTTIWYQQSSSSYMWSS